MQRDAHSILTPPIGFAVFYSGAKPGWPDFCVALVVARAAEFEVASARDDRLNVNHDIVAQASDGLAH